jgi:hypothetical protein
LPSSSRAAAPKRSGLGRLALYYAILAAAGIVLLRYVPLVSEALTGGSAAAGGVGDSFFGTDAPPPVGEVVTPEPPWYQAGLAAMSMLGALAIMLPVTWVYMLTRRQRGFDESVVHTLLMLPVAITGIVMVVKSSLPLAFALAGVSAAVRFRTTLDDTKDAVYVFLAIGVGIAAGIQALGIALALSLVFNAVVLVLWSTRFGNVYAGRGGASMGIGDVLAGPGSAPTALRVGDPAVIEAATPADVAEIAERSARFERHISEERAKKKEKRANALLLVHAKQAEGAQTYVDALLEARAARWKLAEIGPGPSGVLLVYLARLEGEGSQGALMDHLGAGAGGVVEAAELRSLKGIKPRE